MNRKHPPYTKVFRTKVVSLVHSGRKINDVALEFGCHPNSIRTWIRQARLDEVCGATMDAPLGTTYRRELTQLRKQVSKLEAERNLLAKVIRWFSAQGSVVKAVSFLPHPEAISHRIRSIKTRTSRNGRLRERDLRDMKIIWSGQRLSELELTSFEGIPLPALKTSPVNSFDLRWIKRNQIVKKYLEAINVYIDADLANKRAEAKKEHVVRDYSKKKDHLEKLEALADAKLRDLSIMEANRKKIEDDRAFQDLEREMRTWENPNLDSAIKALARESRGEDDPKKFARRVAYRQENQDD